MATPKYLSIHFPYQRKKGIFGEPLVTSFDPKHFKPIWQAFLNRQSWRGGGGWSMMVLDHNFVVIAPMTMKFGTVMKFDVFYTMKTKNSNVTTIT